jgi:hypothetical protein
LTFAKPAAAISVFQPDAEEDMSGTVEIYTVRDEENLRDGEMTYGQNIENRADAAADAYDRCQRDRTIRKVAYYAINDEGDFKVLFVYENPNPAFVKRSKPRPVQAAGSRVRSAGRRPKGPRKASMLEKFLDVLRE